MIDLELDERLFQSYTLSFSIRSDDPKAADLVEDAMLEFAGERFFITDVIKERTDSEGMLSVVAEAGWMRLADIKRPGSTKIENKTTEEGLTQVLEGTGWTAAEVNTSATQYSFEASDASVLDLLWQWAKVTGNEIRFDSLSKSLVFIETIGANKGIGFRYGRNLVSIKRTSSAPKVTRLYAYGRNGIDVSSLNSGVPYLEDFTYYTALGYTEDEARENYRKDEIWVDDSFIEVAALYAAAQARMAILSQPTLLYEASVADLSDLLGLPDYDFRCGDYVRVYDEILEINIQARVSRRVVYPNEPHKNKIELAFSPVLLPDPNAASGRGDTTQQWELFESRNWLTERRVRNFSTLLHRLVLDVVEGAEWVVGFKLQGVGVGTSQLTIEATNDTDDSVIWTSFVDNVTDGQEVNYNFTFGQKDLAAGEYVMVIRAYSDTADAGINIAQSDTAYWFLARGTTRDEISLENSIRYDFNGSSSGTGGTVQTFTVPDDVFEIQIEAHGAAGGPRGGSNAGNGGKVVAKFGVLGGQVYDVYCGGSPNGGGAGWPDAGASPSSVTIAGYGGGGSSKVVPSGGTLANALIVAAGGGGSNATGFSRDGTQAKGGDGGFYSGVAGWGLSPAQTPGVDYAGQGATQTAGGDGGGSPDEGEDGSFGSGGDAAITTNFFHFAGGGGGGGWYGGGGAGGPRLFGGGSYAGDGGGGSGWLRGDAYDIELEDGENNGHGYIIISWETPDSP